MNLLFSKLSITKRKTISFKYVVLLIRYAIKYFTKIVLSSQFQTFECLKRKLKYSTPKSHLGISHQTTFFFLTP